MTGSVTFSVDQLDFQSLTASSITVDGKSVSLDGHVHSASDIDGLQGLTSNSISKDSASFNSVSASSATFGGLTVTGSVTFSVDQLDFDTLTASTILLNGSSVSVEGHSHPMSEIQGLESSFGQVNASISTFSNALQGIEPTSISKSTATFGDLVVTGSVTFSVDQLDFDTLTASTILLNGSSVSVEGHVHTMSEITGLESYVQAFASYESRISYLEGIVGALSSTYVTRSEFVELSASIESILDDIISGQAAAESQINQI